MQVEPVLFVGAVERAAGEGRGRARRAIFKDGVRAALGLGRGGRAKVLPFVFIGLLIAIAAIMALVAGAAERMAGPGAMERLNLPSHGDFYGIASIILFVFAAVVGPELLCRDRREGMIHLYLVRPLTGTDYVLSRFLAFFAVMTVTVALNSLSGPRSALTVTLAQRCSPSLRI